MSRASIRLCLLVCLAWLCNAVPTQANGRAVETAQPAAVKDRAGEPVVGRLKNGLRYTILSRSSGAFQDASRVAVRLSVRGGWQAEGVGENGLAHLIEHLAIDGNGKMTGADVASMRDNLTVSSEWGAWTSPDRTEYFLTAKGNDALTLSNVLTYFHGILHGMRIERSLVDRQRLVNAEEMAGRKLDNERLHRRAQALTPGSEWDVSRGYDSSDVATASIEAVQALYGKIYRPENVTLTIVGDVEPEAIVTLIGERFGSLEAPGDLVRKAGEDRPTRPDAPLSSRFTVDVASIEPSIALVSIVTNSSRQRNSDAVPSLSERAILDRLIREILGHRLAMRALDAGVGGASFQVEETIPGEKGYLWQLQTDRGQWRPVLDLLLDEVTVRPNAFTHREFSIAKGILERRMADERAQAGFVTNSRVAESLSKETIRGEFAQSPHRRLEVERRVLDRLTAGQLDRHWHEVTRGAAVRVRLEGPDFVETIRSPADLAAYVKAHAPSPVRIAEPLAAYGSPVPRSRSQGDIRSDRRSAEGVRSVTFANGVALHLIKRSHGGKFIEVQLVIEDVERRKRLTPCEALVLPIFIEAGGTATRSERQVREAAWGREVYGAGFDAPWFGLRKSASIRIEDFGPSIAGMFETVTRPGFREEAGRIASSRAARALKAITSDPLRFFAVAVERRLGPAPSDTLATFSKECMRSTTMTRASSLLGPMLEEGALEIVVAGDFEEHEVVSVIGATFGRKRQSIARRVSPAALMGSSSKRVGIDGLVDQDGRSLVGAAWHMNEPSDARERAAQEMLVAIFSRMVYHRLVERATSYAPRVGRLEVAGLDGRSILIAASHWPTTDDGFDVAVREISALLANQGPGMEIMETMRSVSLEAIASSYHLDKVWAYQVGQQAARPNLVRDWQLAESATRGLTASEIREAARKIFSRPLTAIAPSFPPGKAAGLSQ